jgi:hypothetical protein
MNLVTTRTASTATLLAVVLAVAGCAPASPGGSSAGSPAPRPSESPTSSPAPDEPPADEGGATVVRFTSAQTSVDVTMGEATPAVIDFLSLLPMTVTIKEFAGREKIADLPRQLVFAGTPGSDPEDGDLIYYTPWGNLGFYYDTSGIGYSDQTLHLGTYDASLEQLTRLEGPVEVTIVE